MDFSPALDLLYLSGCFCCLWMSAMLSQCLCGCDDEALNLQPPQIPRVYAYIDGQNLFRSAHRCFNDVDVPYANCNPIALARRIVALTPGASLKSVRFYTGIPRLDIDEGETYWADFWSEKLRHYSGYQPRGIFRPIWRRLFYEYEDKLLKNGSVIKIPKGREKGIDVRLALDLVLGAITQEYDIVIIFTQDKDLREAISSIQEIRRLTQRWIHLECAFPQSDALTIPSRNPKSRVDQIGLPRTRERKISRDLYRSCLDKQDFRPIFKSGHQITFSGDFEYVGHVDPTTTCQENSPRNYFYRSSTFPSCSSCGQMTQWRRYKKFW